MNKRLDILDREEDIRQWIAEKKPKSFICAELDCKPSTLDSYLNKMGIKYSGNSGLRGYCKTKQGAPIREIIIPTGISVCVAVCFCLPSISLLR